MHGRGGQPVVHQRPDHPGAGRPRALAPDAEEGGRPLRDLVHDEELRTALQRAVDEANRLVSRAESIRKFTVLPKDFTEESGHLTPSLKLKRDAITRDFDAEIEELYRKP